MQSEADKKLIAALMTLHAALPYAGDKQVLQIGIDRLVELTVTQRVDFNNAPNFKGTFDDHPLET